MTLADFQAPIDRIKVALTNVGTDITAIKASLSSKLSDTDEATIQSQLTDIATQLEAIHTTTTA